jgi:hypothetical protein
MASRSAASCAETAVWTDMVGHPFRANYSTGVYYLPAR